MIFNFMLFVTATTYWYMTGHIAPVLIGYVALLMFQEKLAFYAVLLLGIGISSIIYMFYFDYSVGEVVRTSEYGIGVIYMLVLFVKAKRVFDWDDVSLD